MANSITKELTTTFILLENMETHNYLCNISAVINNPVMRHWPIFIN